MMRLQTGVSSVTDVLANLEKAKDLQIERLNFAMGCNGQFESESTVLFDISAISVLHVSASDAVPGVFWKAVRLDCWFSLSQARQE